ncbi:hypothetical protein K3495_g13686 [Podosphaera aphanis]|nr:hypothetical protein K3495_g13686 [Podosphaera aphanis]
MPAPTTTVAVLPHRPNHFHTNTVTAGSVEDILSHSCPRVYQDAARPILRKFYELAIKVSHVRHTLTNLEEHLTAGTFPTSILGALKPDKLQVTKEFTNSADHQDWESTGKDDLFKSRKTALSRSIALKSKEQAYLMSLITQDTIKLKMEAMILEVNASLASVHPGITITVHPKDGDARTVDRPIHFEAARTIAEVSVNMGLAAVQLGLEKHQKEITAQQRRIAKKKEVDVVMQDADPSNIQETIRQEIKALLLEDRYRGRKPAGTVHSPHQCGSLLTPNHRQKAERQTSHQETKATTSQICYERSNFKGKEQRRKRKREWQEETYQEVATIQKALKFRQLVFNPKLVQTYPNIYFRSSLAAQVKFNILTSSVDYVEGLRAHKTKVFMSPGVVIPQEFMSTLSLGGKYILHTKCLPKLLPEAMRELRRSIRIRWFFRNRSNPNYIPKLHVKKPDWHPPLADSRIENAIDAMEATLFAQRPVFPQNRVTFNPQVKHLTEFLQEAKYLVKTTDKNLGLAVVTLDWYRKQCDLHLSNTLAYQRRTIPLNWPYLNERMEHALTFPMADNIREYLETYDTQIPKFHVLPKVHKKVWASRPIIPSHSWITSRASEVLDYFLQPCVKQFNFILDSSKKFLEQLRMVESFEGCILVSGDVRAMYTNINPDAAIKVCCDALSKSDLKGTSVAALHNLLIVVLHHNYFQYNDQIYKQLTGLAMGTACAPAVANLFVAYHERYVLPKFAHKIMYYGRYIDDIFMVIKGTEKDLPSILPFLEAPGLEIEWESSATSLSFLDVSVNIVQNRLVTDLFKKRLNKHMYIPYSSAHPLNVKKAFVKAERTRIDLICSLPHLRRAAERNFYQALYCRGYPTNILDKWFRLELTPREARENPVYILPSVYNPVWEYISMQKCEEAFHESLQSTDLEEQIRMSLILSLRRSRNLYDLYSRHNLTLLNSENVYLMEHEN